MTLEDLGYNQKLEDYHSKNSFEGFDVGRVITEHKDRYTVSNGSTEFEAELIGNLRFTAISKSDLPTVGDWVAMVAYDDNKALIHAIFPRKNVLERQAVGKFGQKQIIASNIDYGLIVQAINRDFSINRLQRYLTLCYASQIEPVIILSKTDLSSNALIDELLDEIKRRIDQIPVLPVSNKTHEGLEALKAMLFKGKTYCLLGSSGVGKSSLINSLQAETLAKTAAISERIDRGKHITTQRQLFPLKNGAILIDNPGMREVGITDNAESLSQTFEKISELSSQCKYSDCTHTSEKGCTVLEALDNGFLDEKTLENYYKMENEQAHFTSSMQERKNKDKNLGKIIREMKSFRKKNPY
jgi:ribosome biogenesis GTPase